MKIFKISNSADFMALCARINCTKEGAKIMRKKSILNFFYIKDLRTPAANILKQDALSIGAELVTAEHVITGGANSDALLIANDKQVEILSKKEKAQDFGLKNLAQFLGQNFKKPKICEIMGVLNLNFDSFNPASRTQNLNEAITKIEKMIEDGADYIDIGGVSSRPGSQYCGADEEFARINGVISEIYRQNLHEKVKFSLDSFDEYCARFALDHGFSLINDISANLNLISVIKNYGAKYCLMHMQNSPQNMQNSPHYDDLISEIDEFFARNLAQIVQLGVEDVILDVGIGFGKTAEQNLILIKNLEHFLHHEKPLLVGASRKSVIDFYHKSSVEERLSGSLYLHLLAAQNGAGIIRVHDVKEHRQMLDLKSAYDKILL
ncbi:dihydropteroate synthase [Campylobacter sp. JMF_08 NE1]|uniref:dihydropteroate synthase n=1 Tax=Campylobacter sp. JMF_08 NE1 TaxID=2983821 RepID=UPI0022E9E01E|nr:dihydropteroate synthase [Campylobacter sp. JMF_08 NE1]MDA3047621.1 dihydropteroate synthase [Campylobacter sp. JMF_08 NE1]